jgi:6-phosphofructokinase 2
MVAGLVYGLDKGADLRQVIRMGIACGSAATMNPGTELFRKEDAERLFKWMNDRMKD